MHGWIPRSFRQNQFALAGLAEPVNLAFVLDPDFTTTTCQGLESDDFWHSTGRHRCRRGDGFNRRRARRNTFHDRTSWDFSPCRIGRRRRF
ncbi:hypothetical protein RB4145 [Rhodopirellula baltica SH 1]|uniref:Uncharacterized protein n=1 Tax=Rhodopirellula baltica (strain DSM 10527 / NCIMB 13988 / SH1) TaxID=243090 RepID=Q7UT32_RHOBA|nr:hypothetical protein RB4145 [Rhodopirellula baltica SH 1]